MTGAAKSTQNTPIFEKIVINNEILERWLPHDQLGSADTNKDKNPSALLLISERSAFILFLLLSCSEIRCAELY